MINLFLPAVVNLLLVDGFIELKFIISQTQESYDVGLLNVWVKITVLCFFSCIDIKNGDNTRLNIPWEPYFGEMFILRVAQGESTIIWFAEYEVEAISQIILDVIDDFVV